MQYSFGLAGANRRVVQARLRAHVPALASLSGKSALAGFLRGGCPGALIRALRITWSVGASFGKAHVCRLQMGAVEDLGVHRGVWTEFRAR